MLLYSWEMEKAIMKPIVLFAYDVDTNLENDCECETEGDCKGSHSFLVHNKSVDYSGREHELILSGYVRSVSLNDDYSVFYRLGNANKSFVAVLNSSAQKFLYSFDRLDKSQNLVEGLKKRYREDEYNSTLDKIIRTGFVNVINPTREVLGHAIPSQNMLTAWVHITDRCNLRCSYCYLPHVREDMSDETGRATIDAIFRSALLNGFKRVKVKYAGGEPLLRFPFVVELHQYAQSLAKQNDMTLDGVVLSNGTLLTTEMIETLKSVSLRLMISLDGLGESHDRHRPYAGGRGSFVDVSNAVRLALDNGIVPDISVTISGRTAESLPELISWILEHDLPFSLNFYRETEFSASNTDMCLDEEKIINGMLAAFKVIEINLPRRSLLPALVDRANLSAPHLHTCGVGQNYLVFDQNGQVAKCQMHIRKPITNIHVVDPLAVIRADQIGIQNLSVEEKEGCRTCEWKYWCTGGCPLATHRATGRYDVKSPNCNIYKALYPEAVRLEGLRLLKYADDPEVVLQ